MTGLVAARALSGAGARVVLLEASERLGGKVRTGRLEGQPAEAGPDSFVAREPQTEELCRALGLGEELVEPAAFGAHVWWRGRLRPLPAGSVLGLPPSPWAALRCRLVSPVGAARMAADLVLSGPLRGPDVSVADLVRRRLGSQVLERLVDPLLGGIRAGALEEMSLATAAPQLDALARGHRGLLVGLRAARSGGATGPPRFLGLRSGMERLVEHLAGDLGPETQVRLARPALGLERLPGGGFEVSTSEQPLPVDGVVLAVPAFAAAGLLRSVAADAAKDLGGIRYASVGLVHLVFPPGTGALPPTGSGFLVPSEERRTLTGCTWVSRKWPHLAPADGGLSLRCFVGRAGEDPSLTLDDRELARRATAEVREALGLSGEPRSTSVVRWKRAIPQYAVGHGERIARVERALGALPGLELAGAAYRGSGLADCVRQGTEAARRVLDELAVSVSAGGS